MCSRGNDSVGWVFKLVNIQSYMNIPGPCLSGRLFRSEVHLPPSQQIYASSTAETSTMCSYDLWPLLDLGRFHMVNSVWCTELGFPWLWIGSRAVTPNLTTMTDQILHSEFNHMQLWPVCRRPFQTTTNERIVVCHVSRSNATMNLQRAISQMIQLKFKIVPWPARKVIAWRQQTRIPDL